MNIEIGMTVSLISAPTISGVVLAKSPRHWWPDLTGCWRVKVPGHGTFDLHGDNLKAA